MPQSLTPICHCSLENALPQSVSVWTLQTTKKCKKNRKPQSKPKPLSLSVAPVPICDGCPAGVTVTWPEGPAEVKSLLCVTMDVVAWCLAYLATRPTVWGVQKQQFSFAAFLLPALQQLPLLPLLAQNSCRRSRVHAELKWALELCFSSVCCSQ